MAVYIPIGTRLDVSLAESAMRTATEMFSRAGDDISGSLSSKISKALGSFDTSAARREIESLTTSMASMRAAEEAAAGRMTKAYSDVEQAQRRILDITGGVADASVAGNARMAKAEQDLADKRAIAARSARDHTDAMVATEAAASKLGDTTGKAADATSNASRAWNAAGITSVALYGAALFETTKKAGDFEASQTRLVASAGETQQNLKAVSDGILQLAGQVGYSAQDLSNAMYTVEKAGYRGSDGVNVLKAAAQGAKSENSDLSEVLGGLTTSMHDFGFSQDQAADVMSKMVAATGMAKTNFQDFSAALHSVEPTAAAVGASLSDVYGSLAQLTQSGMGPAQAADNMNHSFTSLVKPTQQMRDEMGALGIDALDVQEHLGERGLAGTMQLLQQAVAAHSQNGQVDLGAMYQNAGTTRAETEAFNALDPAAQRVAQSIKDNTLSYAEFRKSKGGLTVEQANEVAQWNALNDKVTGFSNVVKSGTGTVQTNQQALALLTGGQDNLRVALQLTGDNMGATNDKIKEIDGTTREHDGTVKGFTETQQTLNAKMADAKDAFGAAAIEIGSAFVPVMTDVANVAKTVGDTMAQHPGIAHAVIDALEMLGGAWLTFKALNIAETILMPIATGLGTIVAGEEGATAGAAGLSAALGAVGPIAAGVAGGKWVGDHVAATDHDHYFNPDGSMKGSGDQWIVDNLGPVGKFLEPSGAKTTDELHGHADGGAISGSGPKGKDSVPTWMAPGEHVLTASDVDAMGGQGSVYAFRNSLHRADGGGYPGDAALLSNVPAGSYTQSAHDLSKGLDDCSGAVGDLVKILDGQPTGGQNLNTGNAASWLPAHGFLPGSMPGAFNVGFNSEHMQATLPGGTPFNWGSDAAAARRGIGGSGADDPAFTSHYYRPVDGSDKTFAAQERVGKLEDRIRELQQQISEETVKTKQSEKDKLDDDLKRTQEELDHAKGDLATAQQGSASGSGRGSGSGGGLQFGAKLPENFGLGKGIPGFFEWLTTFAADMAIGPIEGKMYGDALRAGGLGGDGSSGDASQAGGFADLGAPFGSPASGSGLGPLPGPGPGPGGGGGAPASLAAAVSGSGGGGGGSSSGGGTPSAPDNQSAIWNQVNAAIAQRGAPTAAPAATSGPPAPFRTAYGPFPASPTLSTHTLEALHDDGSGGWGGTAAANAPTAIPTLPGGGVDWNQLRGRFPGGSIPAPSVQSGSREPGGTSYGEGPHDPYAWMYAPHFNSGGPSGNDTIPAWLAPGEMVMNKSAVDGNQQALQFMNAGHYDGGTPAPLPAQPAAAAPPPPKTAAPAPGGPAQKPAQGKPPEGQQHIPAGGPASPGPGNQPPPPPGAQTQDGVTTPGASKSAWGADLPASGGIGFGGGLIGAAESLPGMAASAAGAAVPGGGAAAGAASGAMQLGFQLMNRAAGYAGQLGGIAAEGILSTFLPSDSSLSNFSNTLPGKLISGVAGVRPGTPNSAGKTQAPLKPEEGDKKGNSSSDSHDTHFNAPITVKADNPDAFQQQMQRQYSAAQSAYPMRTP